jgi:hypothetical protein
MSFAAFQKTGSKLTLVLWPPMTIDLLATVLALIDIGVTARQMRVGPVIFHNDAGDVAGCDLDPSRAGNCPAKTTATQSMVMKRFFGV